VHRRLRRPAAALCAVLLLPALAACGDSDKTDDPGASESSADAGTAGEAGQLEEVTFEGEVGEGITATWNDAIEQPDETTVTTLVEGEGEALADGDTVSTYLYVGNGTSKKDLYSDYDNGAPEAIPNTDDVEELFQRIFDGATYGSRVVAVTTPSEVFGESLEGNPLGVTATDSLVIVADLIEKQAVAPTPTDNKVHDATPDSQPTVVEKDGKPSALDFSGIDEPELDTPVQRLVLEEGDGATVKESDTVSVNYLGSTYDADAPFDESFSTGQPLESPLSGLIPGWTVGLTGVKVGSRVLIQIPPALGYGAEGSPPAIPGNATLWFVIDVLEVK
jgi:peptidylprolyl isomerase